MGKVKFSAFVSRAMAESKSGHTDLQKRRRQRQPAFVSPQLPPLLALLLPLLSVCQAAAFGFRYGSIHPRALSVD